MADRSYINDAAHWRQRAEETRALANDMKDEKLKQTMLRIAEDYARLTQWAEARIMRRPPNSQ
jgi:hypothetical protein